MNLKRFFLLWIFPIALIACVENNQFTNSRLPDNPKLKLRELKFYEETNEHSLVENRGNYNFEIEYIQLETSDKCLIGSIDKIYQHGNYLIILDKKNANAVYVFDVKGKFLNKIGEIGKGKGEYLILSDFDVNEALNYVYLYDNHLNKLITYSLDDSLINEINIPFNAPRFSYLNNSFYFVTDKYPNLDKFKYHLMHVSVNGKIIEKLLPYTDFDILSRKWTPRACISSNRQVDSTLLLFSTVFRSDINCITNEGLFKFLPVDWGGKLIKIINLEKNPDIDIAKKIVELSKEITTQYSKVFYTGNYIIFDKLHPYVSTVFYNYMEQKVMFGLDTRYLSQLSRKGDFISHNIYGVSGDYIFTYIRNETIGYALRYAKKYNTIVYNKINSAIPNFNMNNNPVIVKYKVYE